MTNGHRTGLRLPDRTATLVFEGDYAGVEVTVRLSVPLGRYLAILDIKALQEQAEVFGREVLVAWNVQGPDGAVLPANADGMLALPPSMVDALLSAWVRAVRTPLDPLPKTSADGGRSAA